MTESLHYYIPLFIRKQIENDYYAKINERLILENFIKDPLFVENPFDHLALYTDHGVVHVRNVAELVLELMPRINGVLIPERNTVRLEFMKGYAAMLAYLHDIGMVNGSAFGRAMHAEFIAHEVFSPHVDPIIDAVWESNAGGLAWKILNLITALKITTPAKTLLRELLAMAYCHSKSAVPIAVVNDKQSLQKCMRYCLTHTLAEIYWEKQIKKLTNQWEKNDQLTKEKRHQVETHLKNAKKQYKKLEDKESIHHKRASLLSQYYSNFAEDSYQWLTGTSPCVSEFSDDIIDTLRLVRGADALRQRGTNLKTSGNYQIFIDQSTANAVYALKSKTNKLFLLAGDRPINSAEANIASVNITEKGDLAFSFYHGHFETPEAIEKAINNLVLLIEDIQTDVIDSFHRSPALANKTAPYLKKNQSIYILLESTDDNLNFTPALSTALIKANPALESIIKLVPSLHKIPEQECQRYLSASNVTWSLKNKKKFLKGLEENGHKIKSFQIQEGFNHVKLTKLKVGEVLMELGDYAGFVYIPLNTGLIGLPGGGYSKFEVAPMIPLGSTGAIRGDVRNSTIVAENDVEIMIIPREIYLKYWHATYNSKEIKKIIKKI